MPCCVFIHLISDLCKRQPSLNQGQVWLDIVKMSFNSLKTTSDDTINKNKTPKILKVIIFDSTRFAFPMLSKYR